MAEIATLGTFSLDENGTNVLAPGKPLATLAYLACSSDRSASRGTLVSALWADLEPDAAKHALRQTLWYLKKKTGRDLLLSEGDSLRLIDAVAIDRDKLLSAAKTGDHASVVAHYRGPFIPDFAAPGGAGFEAWAALERRRLHEIFRNSAAIYVHSLLDSGRGRDATTLAKRLRDEDVHEEGGWRLLIEACASAGDLLTARAEAEALVQLAEVEGFELEPATRAAIRAARGSKTGELDAVSSLAGPSLAPSLVGREESFAALLRAWETAKGGHPQRVHISARPGFGKTRLLKDLATRLKAVRTKVVTVGGSLGAREIAYAAAGDFAAALASLPGRSGVAPESAATLVELNPAVSTWFDKPARRATLDDPMRGRTAAVRELLAAVAFENPVAILIDDLHWWDDASATLLSAVLGTLGEARVLVVTAARPEARKLALLAGTNVDIPLDALSQSQVEELVVSIATLPAAPWAQVLLHGLWRASRGSPLLIIGMLQLLEERQLVSRLNGEWQCDRVEVLEAELEQSDVLRARLADLDRSDLWLLTLIAVGRTNLDLRVLSEATGRTAEELTGRLNALESRGLVIRDGSDWRAAHDEIADEVLRTAPPDATPRAASQLGSALLTAAPFTEAVARRAAQVLRIGGEASTRHDLLREFARRRFALGDRRSIASIAADLLGADARSAEVRALVKGAPWSWRLGLVSAPRKVAALVALTGALLAPLLPALRAATPAPPDAVAAFAFTDPSGQVSWVQAEIRQQDWVPQQALTTTPWNPPENIRLISENAFGADYSGATGMLVTQRPVEGDETIDLFLTSRTGEVRRLRSARDDGGASLSPDGRLVAFSTARWDTLFHYDIALMGVDDSIPTQLTRNTASDGGPRWSPDGSRLAFGRHNWGEKPNELCVIEVQSRTESCVPARDEGTFDAIGWIDDDRLLVQRMRLLTEGLEVIRWSTGERIPVAAAGIDPNSLSPDGLWLSCFCVQRPNAPPELAILPLSAPQLMRPVRVPVGKRFAAAVWLRSARSRLAARVRISPVRQVRAGVPAALSAAVYDQRGNLLTLHGGIRWSVVDSTAANIDSLSGNLVATGRTAAVRVVARAGTSAVDTLSLQVDTLGPDLLFEEAWSSLAAWAPFGSPSPTVARLGDSTGVFLNNGEGSFQSGAFSRRSFGAGRGIAVEARISTPITRPQWQLSRLGLTEVDSTRLATMRSGTNVPPLADITSSPCAIGYPQEGRVHGLRPYLQLSSRTVSVDVRHEGLFGGRWANILVQLLPDGRCGFAIDGVPIGIVAGPPIGNLSVRVLLDGNSRGTRIAVGPLAVWEGVRTDIDWSRALVYK